MIELAPELMAALQVEAERQGKSVSEIVAKVIKEWIDPEPWFDINEPVEPQHCVVLPVTGETYISADGGFSIRVKTVKPMWEPPQPLHIITIETLKEYDGSEWEEHQIYGETWMEFIEDFGLTLEEQAA
jgi:hypothetical protein